MSAVLSSRTIVDDGDMQLARVGLAHQAAHGVFDRFRFVIGGHQHSDARVVFKQFRHTQGRLSKRQGHHDEGVHEAGDDGNEANQKCSDE